MSHVPSLEEGFQRSWLEEAHTFSIAGIPYNQLIAEGLVPNHDSINKFGQNKEIDSGVTADVWSGGRTVGALPAGSSLLWIAPTAACKHNITSTSASDDGDLAGVGARTIKIYGLPDWDTAEINEDIVMNGTGNVLTENTYVIIHRMKVLTKGATSANVGTITATATSPSDVTVTARIDVGNGQTLMAVFGVPSIQTLYLDSFYSSIKRGVTAAASVDILLLVNPEPDVELLNFLCKHTFGLLTQGTSAVLSPYSPPKKIEGPAIVKIQAVSGANDMSVSAGFDGILVTL